MQRQGTERGLPDEPGWYDFAGEMGVPYFHWGGMKSTERLLRLCRVGRESRVLVVGCGTGYSACHIAEKFGCRVVGFDLSPKMAEKAHERARERDLAGRARFLVADAHALPFGDASFDIVMSEFVTILLRKEEAFGEYTRCLRQGGFVGVNELYISEATPPRARERIEEAGRGFEEAVGLALYLSTPSEWEGWFTAAGLRDFRSEEIRHGFGLREYVRAAGGSIATLKLVGRVLYGVSRNKRRRDWARKMSRLKRTLMNDPRTRRYVRAALYTGKKKGTVTFS